MSVNSARYENLDYLRGLCALSILCYHYIGWVFSGLDASTFLGKLGVYGVSIFYVLSGLTMYLVYFKNFNLDSAFFKNFYIKRIFRIFPLMWLVILLNFLLTGYHSTLQKDLLNFSGLFSVFNWTASLPLGMWSIGNELSFYFTLPVLFFCMKQGKIFTLLISIVVFGIYFYFAFFILDKSNPISVQDNPYKNPLNQMGLFFGGILIGHFFKAREFKNIIVLSILIISLLAFYFYPSHGNAINIIVGYERIIFTLLCFTITLGFFKSNLNFLPFFLKRRLTFLGKISYSLYLIHGLVFYAFTLTGLKIRYVLPLSVAATFACSWLIFIILESPARKLGVKLTELLAYK